jgi:RNA polymerase sigma factor (sigma-70 family)
MSHELNRISREMPSFEAMYEELATGQGKLFWAYYFPVCMRFCEEFFRDEVMAQEATLPLFEKWSSAAAQYNADIGKMKTFFNQVARNFCINWKRDHSYGPEIIYQGDSEMAGEFQDDDDTMQESDQTLAYSEDYPSDGIDREDPEALMIKQEEEWEVGQRAATIRAELTVGDQDVFDLLVQDYTYPEIAEALGRTEKGIENSIGRIRAVVSTHV